MGYEAKQSTFRQHELQYPDILDTLNTQVMQLLRVKYEVDRENHEAINELIKEIDFNLIRYACAKFGRMLEEAARDDCAQLIAASATDPGNDKKCRDAWKDWLLAAPCWASLARSHWSYSLSRAAELVIEKLEKQDGFNLDGPEGREVLASIARLEISDLVAPEIYQQAFPQPVTTEESEETF